MVIFGVEGLASSFAMCIGGALVNKNVLGLVMPSLPFDFLEGERKTPGSKFS